MTPRRPSLRAAIPFLILLGCTEAPQPPVAPVSPSLDAGAEAFSDFSEEGVGHASAAGVTQSASGHSNLTVNGQARTFSFTAIRHRDGEVTGQFELHNHTTGVRLHGAVTCFLAFARPEDPKRGAMFAGGVITHGGGVLAEGTPVIFNAFDNGEGANALFPDFASLLLPTIPPVVARQCALGLRITPVLPIEGGNIQIRP